MEQARDNVCVPVFRREEEGTGSSLVRAPPLPVRVPAGGSEQGLRCALVSKEAYSRGKRAYSKSIYVGKKDHT